MFTGIVEGKGVIQAVEKKTNLAVLTIKPPQAIRGIRIGDSIAVDGVCLTVTVQKGNSLTFDMMKETLDLTTLGRRQAGDRVNLERALPRDGRFSGHFVTGHVDGMGRVRQIVLLKNYVEVRISVPQRLMPCILPKGSVTVDGVSLTVGRTAKESFSVYLIPHTLKVTSLGDKKVDDLVNIETDILAKYVQKR